jgi:hypothetical protein
MSDTFELNCCVLSGDPSPIFMVKIRMTESVGALKTVIKDEQKETFQHVDADSLILSRVSVPIDRIMSLNDDLTKLDLDGRLSLNTQKLSEVFFETPIQTHLHIVVRGPPGEFSVITIYVDVFLMSRFVSCVVFPGCPLARSH